MRKIDSTEFGSITVDGKRYDHDVIVTSQKVKETRTETRHLIAEKEFNELIAEEPELVIIGNGQYGDMEISDIVRDVAKKSGIKIVVLPTPEAIGKFNELINEGKKVVAYMHVTC